MRSAGVCHRWRAPVDGAAYPRPSRRSAPVLSWSASRPIAQGARPSDGRLLNEVDLAGALLPDDAGSVEVRVADRQRAVRVLPRRQQARASRPAVPAGLKRLSGICRRRSPAAIREARFVFRTWCYDGYATATSG